MFFFFFSKDFRGCFFRLVNGCILLRVHVIKDLLTYLPYIQAKKSVNGKGKRHNLLSKLSDWWGGFHRFPTNP